MKKQQFLTNSAIVAAALSLTGLLLGGCGPRGEENAEKPAAEGQASTKPAAQSAAPVRLATAKRETVTDYVQVTGSLAALQNVALSPKLNARVISVNGREGAAVSQGQVVVQQETSDYRVQVQQAQANLQASQARLTQAEAGLKSAQARLTQAKRQVDLQTSQSTAGVQDAQEQVRSAEAQLEIARRPQRTQEIEVAENNVAQAQANYDRARVDRDRYAGLFKEGAVAKATLDQYETQEQVARANLASAKKQLELAQIGGREENVQNAEAALARAKSALRLAQANQDQIKVRQDDVRAAEAALNQARAEVQAARAAVAQNRAAVAAAQLLLADTTIRSPIDGVISDRLVEPGQVVGPTATVMRLVALDTVFFEAQVPETELSSLEPGMPVNVTTDAFAGKTFPGKIARIYPTGDTGSRTVVVRVEISNPNKMLRPGLFARGAVVTQERQGVVVPRDAVVTSEGETVIFVAEDGTRAVRRPVRLGIATADSVEILSGISEGESVITAGQGVLTDGAPIKVEGDSRQTASL
ncbi:MAG: efflux RND transporter periplasmic adaptor subunit [Armatimonadaceae bacterium]